MPIYDIACRSCGKNSEVLADQQQRSADLPGLRQCADNPADVHHEFLDRPKRQGFSRAQRYSLLREQSFPGALRRAGFMLW